MRVQQLYCPFWSAVWFAVFGFVCSGSGQDDRTVYSGPQPGEKLPSFKIRVLSEEMPQEVDPVALSGGGPLFLVFVHEVTRPSVGLSRVLMEYAATRKKDGLTSALVFLADDITAQEQWMQRARHALPKEGLLGICVDGKEGPGAYGLNRNVTMTILIARNGQVVANFALVQPSLQVDAPKILESLVRTIGGETPKLEELLRSGSASAAMPNRLVEAVRRISGPEISQEEVERIAQRVEGYVNQYPDNKPQLGRLARRVLDDPTTAGRLTEAARQYLSKWAKQFGGAPGTDGKR
ncbi:MAG: hypothetical protein KatS3mg110_4651 [Pirellulaceae bacterium]|nr:MAG: hypothetical protein KatS3mg110_4651 [Pirellulaceae bacterium]